MGAATAGQLTRMVTSRVERVASRRVVSRRLRNPAISSPKYPTSSERPAQINLGREGEQIFFFTLYLMIYDRIDRGVLF